MLTSSILLLITIELDISYNTDGSTPSVFSQWSLEPYASGVSASSCLGIQKPSRFQPSPSELFCADFSIWAAEGWVVSQINFGCLTFKNCLNSKTCRTYQSCLAENMNICKLWSIASSFPVEAACEDQDWHSCAKKLTVSQNYWLSQNRAPGPAQYRNGTGRNSCRSTLKMFFFWKARTIKLWLHGYFISSK